MKISRLSLAIFAVFILAACVSGVQGQFQEQYVTPSSVYSTGAPIADRSPLQFSQFWSMAAEISPGNPISAPQQFEIASSIPSIIYLGEQMQTVPYAQYQFDPAYTSANSLWIAGKTAWTQYAVIPLGSAVSLYAISPMGGTGPLNFVDSNGQSYSHNYSFYPDSMFTFYADTAGRHILSFALNGQTSNQVVIDVASPSPQQGYQEPYQEPYPSYYPGYYPWYYSGSYYPVYVPSKSQVEIHKDDNIDGHHPDGTPKKDDKGGDKGGNNGGDDKKGDKGKHDKGDNSGGDDKGADKGWDDKGSGNDGHDHTRDVGNGNQNNNKGIGNRVGDTGWHNKGGEANGDKNHGKVGGNQGGANKPECGPGHHLENGECVADEVNATG